MVAIPPGLEPGTYCLEGSCSIQLSYGTIGMRRRSGMPQDGETGKVSDAPTCQAAVP